MIAAGIDLGGTKIEAQIFDADWAAVAHHRVPTPRTYADLVPAIADQVAWIDAQVGHAVPVGISAAGLINPATGMAFTANLPATGHPLPADISARAGRHITYINDCRALALSEAIFGAGKGHRTVLALILGTGVGGGIAVDGALTQGPTMTGGEFGHTSAPAHLVNEYGLPLVTCGCGQIGCIETYIAGPGMSRIADAMLGKPLTPEEVSQTREGPARAVWQAWLALTADLLRTLTLTADPDIIVLGGGLSKMPDVAQSLSDALSDVQLGGFKTPPIVTAQGGAASGARGAAYAASLGGSNV